MKHIQRFVVLLNQSNVLTYVTFIPSPNSYLSTLMSNWNTHPRTSPGFNANWQNPRSDDSSTQQSPLPLLVPNQQQIPNPYLEKHLSYRMWFSTPFQEYFRKSPQQYFKFHLVCYNILAQLLLEENSFLYENCFFNNLMWFRRRDRLIREFLRQDADILCLQEVQVNHYEKVFHPALNGYGYESIYVKRSGDKSDGCCIFYKINRLKLITSKVVPFYQRNIRLLDRDNCGLIALFQPLTPNATSNDRFCVATTHLLFSPKRGDIKLAQIQYFLAEIDQLAMKNPQNNTNYPIILCGDFNAHPQSPLIQFLLTGSIKYDTYRCIDISNQPTGSNQFSYSLPSDALLPPSFVTSDCRLPHRISIKQHTSAILTHDKQFKSVYDLNNSSDVTTNVNNTSKLVDYILFTGQENDPDRLNLLSHLELYKEHQMTEIHMPNHQFPSDHFLLAGKFALKLEQ